PVAADNQVTPERGQAHAKNREDVRRCGKGGARNAATDSVACGAAIPTRAAVAAVAAEGQVSFKRARLDEESRAAVGEDTAEGCVAGPPFAAWAAVAAVAAACEVAREAAVADGHDGPFALVRQGATQSLAAVAAILARCPISPVAAESPVFRERRVCDRDHPKAIQHAATPAVGAAA